MKKVFYILNLLFLTLSVFGGSVFAADQYYFKGDGTTALMPATSPLPNGTVKAGNYTVSGTISGQYTIASGETVNIYVTGNVTGSDNNVWFCVPESATLNFYSGASSAAATYNPAEAPTFSITNGQLFTIGTSTSYGDGFGTINFNSGNYTVINENKSTPSVAIGSPDKSGGEINVNQAAVVNAIAYNVPSTAVGTPEESQECEINVIGALLTKNLLMIQESQNYQ